MSDVKIKEAPQSITINLTDRVPTSQGGVSAVTHTLQQIRDLFADDFAPALTADQNYISDEGLIVLGNTSGTNTGDQDLSGKGGLNAVQTWTKGQIGEVTALASTAGSIAINLSDSNNFSHTFTENTTLAAPSNPVAGQSGVITLTQHASAPKTLAYNTFWKFAGGTIPSVTATNGAVDLLTYYVIDSGKAVCNLIKGVA